jgi:hypothetical protein
LFSVLKFFCFVCLRSVSCVQWCPAYTNWLRMHQLRKLHRQSHQSHHRAQPSWQLSYLRLDQVSTYTKWRLDHGIARCIASSDIRHGRQTPDCKLRIAKSRSRALLPPDTWDASDWPHEDTMI